VTAVTSPATTGIAVRLVGVVHLYPTPDGDVVALRGVDLDVAAGESVALLGPSGAGKSTVLSLIAGEFTPSSGQVLVGDVDIARVGAPALAELRASQLSLVSQQSRSNLLPYATGVENLWLAQHGARSRGLPLERTPHQLFELFGLSALAERRVGQLSSGERQCVALLTGVATLPRLLLIDEPTSQLPPAMRDVVVSTINALHEELGMTAIVVTHDDEVAGRLDRTVTIREGRVGAEGRRGVEHVVVGRDGTLPLPPDALELLPPGSLVTIARHGGALELRRVATPDA